MHCDRPISPPLRQRNRAVNTAQDERRNRPPPLPILPPELRAYEESDDDLAQNAQPPPLSPSPRSTRPESGILLFDDSSSEQSSTDTRRSRPRVDPQVLPPLDLAFAPSTPTSIIPSPPAIVTKPRSSMVDPATMARPQLARLDLASGAEMPRKAGENGKAPSVILIVEAPEYQMRRTLRVELTTKLKDVPNQFLKGQKNSIAALEDYGLFLVMSNATDIPPQSSAPPNTKMFDFKRQGNNSNNNKQNTSEGLSTRMLPPNSTVGDLELKDMVRTCLYHQCCCNTHLFLILVNSFTQADSSAGDCKAHLGNPA